MELALGEEPLTTFRQALDRVTALAHAKLPAELHGALERATALVIHRHVWMDEDGRHAQVLSSDGQTWYHVNAHCTCMGVTHAPQGLCKHRLAVAMYRRASELLAEAGSRGQAEGEGSQGAGTRGEGGHPDSLSFPAASLPHSLTPSPLPEAPASVNVRLCIGGADVQWTLRDADEDRLAARLERLLARFPQAAKAPQAGASAAAQTQGGTPTCQYHGAMRESTKVKGTFYCPSRMGDGTFCKEKSPKK